MGRQLSRQLLSACATYLGRISVGMPTKPSFFGKPSWLGKEQHNNSQDITVGRHR